LFGGRFGDSEKANDFAIMAFSILTQSINLNVEGKSLPFLLSAADSRQCDVSFFRFHQVAVHERKQTSPFDEVHFSLRIPCPQQ
jgi:hypothetical protein